ncbi:MAG TPA: LysR family transcriptional regulator [Polyangiaceae bacterium]|nr:LysR family transcriptional regulator [Polyangiaceae bacterium]
MFDWDDVRYFLAVARSGSLSAAARVLQVAQPTVGRRITAFERRLGAELFERTLEGQKLTATGRRVLATAERMEEEALALEQQTGRDPTLRGRVRITASEWLIQRLLAPILVPFNRAHPELELELWADIRHLSLTRREADIAVRPSPFEQGSIVQRVVAELKFGLYASDHYLLERGVPDFSRACEGHVLIAMSESLGKIPDVEFLPRVAAKARIATRTNGREPMAVLAAAGLGIACLPRFLGDATAGLRHLPCPEPEPTRRLYVGFLGDDRAASRIQSCVTFLAHTIPRLRSALAPS